MAKEEASEMAGWPLPKAGAFVWTEIASNDADKCQAFYDAVFGWEFNKGDGASGMDYREFTTGGNNPTGGLYQIDPDQFDGNPPPPHFITYVAVDDVDKNAKLAKELGGKIHKIMDVPNVGRVAIIEDPTGATIATFRMKN